MIILPYVPKYSSILKDSHDLLVCQDQFQRLNESYREKKLKLVHELATRYRTAQGQYLYFNPNNNLWKGTILGNEHAKSTVLLLIAILRWNFELRMLLTHTGSLWLDFFQNYRNIVFVKIWHFLAPVALKNTKKPIKVWKRPQNAV